MVSDGRFEAGIRSPSEAIDIFGAEDQHTSGAYPKRPAAMVRGEGAYLWDSHGRRYLDLTSGQGVALLGHSHPRLVEAVQQQSSTLITCPEIFYNDQRAQLYTELAAILPEGLTRMFLCNSGAEAIEGAIKIARLITDRSEIIATRGGFHGRTFGALSATWNPRYRKGFEPLLPDVAHVPYNDLQAIENAVSQRTAAVLLEVVQGEGGVISCTTDYLRDLRKLCDQFGTLLVLDEIQTGLGRTGRWFACQHHDVNPDILCLGKGIAGGLPMGVVAWSGALGPIPNGSHGSTFGGNPLVCAAARATLQTLKRERLPQRAARLGEEILNVLQKIDNPMLREVRGMGLMIGLDLRQRVTPVLKDLMARDILALPAGPTVLRLLPPLVIDQTDLKQACDEIVRALEKLGRDKK